ncbi:MAG: hypothetical protein E6J87_18405 [Deltaproteobacteria bacterium]|nr:MAG: hypothetical protein E6J87_18405 [Deltaproteobacteria bacterium]
MKAKSDARGGAGGRNGQAVNPGGNADASATAIGLGLVEAWAHAAGGNSTSGAVFGGPPTAPFGAAGSAIAHASADGASGFARAEAISGLGDQPQLRAQSEAQVGSHREVAAEATNGVLLASAPSDPGLDGGVLITSAPLQQDIDAARAGNGAFPGKEMLALAYWQGASDGDGLILSTDLELAPSAAADTEHHLMVGAFGISVVGDEFLGLTFSLAKNGVAIGAAHTFATLDDVMTFFAGTLFDLGPGWSAGDHFLAHFDLALAAHSEFAMNVGYATAVPESGTGVLLVFGLIAIARVRRRAAFSA